MDLVFGSVVALQLSGCICLCCARPQQGPRACTAVPDATPSHSFTLDVEMGLPLFGRDDPSDPHGLMTSLGDGSHARNLYAWSPWIRDP